MKILAISDTHNLHEDLVLPKADVIVFAGDATTHRHSNELKKFATWWMSLDYKYKIFTPGNHDGAAEAYPELLDRFRDEDAFCLIDEQVTIEGIKFYVSPYSATFQNWHFMVDRGEAAKQKWAMIPDDTDILVTHGPPLGVMDKTYRGDVVGDGELFKAVRRVKPKYHIFGHIHEEYGQRTIEETTFCNVSNHLELWRGCEGYRTPPTVLEI